MRYNTAGFGFRALPHLMNVIKRFLRVRVRLLHVLKPICQITQSLLRLSQVLDWKKWWALCWKYFVMVHFGAGTEMDKTKPRVLKQGLFEQLGTLINVDTKTSQILYTPDTLLPVTSEIKVHQSLHSPLPLRQISPCTPCMVRTDHVSQWPTVGYFLL